MSTAIICTGGHDGHGDGIGSTLVDLPCGCQDVHYADGTVCFEHAHAECHDAGVVLVRGELRQVSG